jgi:hypothetical protein
VDEDFDSDPRLAGRAEETTEQPATLVLSKTLLSSGLVETQGVDVLDFGDGEVVLVARKDQSELKFEGLLHAMTDNLLVLTDPEPILVGSPGHPDQGRNPEARAGKTLQVVSLDPARLYSDKQKEGVALF